MADAIVAKARAMYGKRLTAEDYNILLHCKSIVAVVTYLKGTERYHNAFDGINESTVHRGQVEQILAREVFESYLRMCRFMAVDKNSFCYYLIKEREMKEILTVLMYIGSDSVDGYVKILPSYLIDHTSFDLLALANARTYDDILDVLSGTPYAKVLKPLISGREPGSVNLEECGVALYINYIRWVFKVINKNYRGKEAKTLKENLLKQADLDNIQTCYRMRKFFAGETTAIEKSLKPYYYRVTPARLDEILEASDADEKLIEILKKIYLRNDIEYDAENLEVTVRRYNNRYYKRQLYFSEKGTITLYSIMILNEIERSNIQKIIEGIRYELDPAEIRKLLVE